MKTDWAVICGNHINTYSIIASLRAIGWPGSIVSIKTASDGFVFTELLGKETQVWECVLNSPSDLLSVLSSRVPKSDEKVVFFTSERFHEAFRDRDQEGEDFPNSRFYIGSKEHLDTILDRYAFYHFIQDRDLADVPHTISSEEDPWAAFGDRFCIRMKRSWEGIEKLTGRVKLVTDRSQLEQIESDYRASGLTQEMWCYQEALSTALSHNISVCGWHDCEHQTYVTTRHLLKHPDAFGNGVITEAIDPPPGLHQSAHSILEALDYSGPFELEFIFDPESERYKVIELNPRFWMQHGLVEAMTDHELVRRYVGERMGKTELEHKKRYWVNTTRALPALLALDKRVLAYLRDPRSVVVPSYHLALGRFAQSFLNSLIGRIRA